MIELAEIRPYRPTDRADVYDICVRTAASGGDARGVYSSDDLMPDVWAGPYVDLQPELALVVDTGERASGYIIGTADTRRFVRLFRSHWLPAFAERYANPSSVDRPTVAQGLDPERMLIPEVDDYPAHLHIDLLPDVQAMGLGRVLIESFANSLRSRGVPGLHLTIDPANTGAKAFYDRLGFVELGSGALAMRL